MKTLLTAAALLVAMAAPAFAREGAAPAEPASTEMPALSIRHGDLDLASERGAALMLGRLKRAVADVCAAPGIDRPTPALRREMAACRSAALSDAVEALNAPAVTQLYRAEATQTVALQR
jgi:UrcA family protein